MKRTLGGFFWAAPAETAREKQIRNFILLASPHLSSNYSPVGQTQSGFFSLDHTDITSLTTHIRARYMAHYVIETYYVD